MNQYDYIVIGAGSAGCAVARRLSDDANLSVLLLEAGGPSDGFWNRTPAGVAKLHKSERVNWNYTTEPVPRLNNRKIYWPAGKALGGGSAINGMVYIRGDRRDFDHWAEQGNAGWAWDDVLPYFKRSETNVRGASGVHGASGPLYVSDPSVVHPTIHDFISSATACGLPHRTDFAFGEQEGAGTVQYTIKNGERYSSYRAYIEPVKDRRNLTVETGVKVCRILLEGRVATGVEVIMNGQKRSLQARQEVILSAGAIRSPHLLMLSGIGNAQHLQDHGVPLVAHLPGVGQNLQDHLTVRVQAQTGPESSYNAALRGWRKYMHGARYILTKSGYLALGTSSAAAFLKSSSAVDYADIEISFRAMTFTALPSGKVEIDNYDAISGSVYRVRPASRGAITLRSADPAEAPLIQPNYLGDPEDLTATVAGIRAFRRILAASPLAARLHKELVPGADADTDEKLADYVRRDASSVFHPAGSCKMGHDDMAVVDSKLRVLGVERLRVIDASIMPVVTSGNTNAPSIMIGEKGADLLRERLG
ncbi:MULTISPECIES: GMC family oxidoreductase N-terminal domain-containing protein [unclassified Mesorhizobium]|uniref:GMC family oxidoreductase n=1 Tax=unclassified Mesorhizobium TaxID=325217 RepID=UPI000FDC3B9B|nr:MULTISPECIES: GMC family oxidoreductase N-terminal domain-containing protein [unclassified Mesorhizobium]TGR23046.1 choline dehydrogenase [Mesorhizobium sp. M8A.F.Ca.ET.197.01.1.1]TGR39133.1 choline dehydrogenase [bacterium M00.F.Ca.ET.199.01.1.1]TGR46726.1 choline dehydrogenase [Mesorhizobium sp. M8A.F.Ca.ET.198.01.1.1]TGV85200.1 choline dehydrogenase [Mesorhizobium sp. M00.F.Ca.ET.149.01.1.1]